MCINTNLSILSYNFKLPRYFIIYIMVIFIYYGQLIIYMIFLIYELLIYIVLKYWKKTVCHRKWRKQS